jgi:hypothetical protein
MEHPRPQFHAFTRLRLAPRAPVNEPAAASVAWRFDTKEQA